MRMKEIILHDLLMTWVVGLGTLWALWKLPDLIQLTELLKNIVTIAGVCITILVSCVNVWLRVRKEVKREDKA